MLTCDLPCIQASTFLIEAIIPSSQSTSPTVQDEQSLDLHCKRNELALSYLLFCSAIVRYGADPIIMCHHSHARLFAITLMG